MLNELTNKFEKVKFREGFRNEQGKTEEAISKLKGVHTEFVKLDGSPIPITVKIFKVDELVTIKDYTFRVAYIGESNILFEPVRPEDALSTPPER